VRMCMLTLALLICLAKSPLLPSSGNEELL
jgi:hypothetical protein